MGTVWHRMSLAGKVLLFFVGFGFGLATGFYYGDNQVINEGNEITVEFDGKIKKDSKVNINLNDIDQEQDNGVDNSKTKKKKWFNK